MAYDLQLDRPVRSNIAKIAVPACPSCDSPGRRLLHTVVEHEYSNTTDDEFFLKECTECGTWFLDPRPAETALDIIYPPNYYAYVLAEKARDRLNGPSGRGLMQRIALALFVHRMRPVMKQLEIGPETTWLDVGCGAGYALEAIQKTWGIRGTGLDLSESAVRSCRERGFEAFAGRVEDHVPRVGESYDLIHSSHLIEHLGSPLEYMRQSWDLLKPGGLNVFFTPNTATPEARHWGRYWGGLHVPRHWAMLSDRSARILGERSGFEHVRTKFLTSANFWVWGCHSSLRGSLPSKWNDRLFPSDHRMFESTFGNLARGTFFTAFDVANLLVTGRSSNMLCIFRKPRA